jgi:hypothetical protein
MNSWLSLSVYLICLTTSWIAPTLSHIHCRTKVHSKNELDSMEKRLKQEKATQQRSKSSLVRCIRCITIDTYVYVFHRSNGEGTQVNQNVINEQMEVLNRAYAQSPFRFRLVASNFVIDDLFHSRFLVNEKGEDSLFPEALNRKYPRFGGYSTLNMYFGGVDAPASFGYLPSLGGLTSVPWDGVYVFLESVPRVYSFNQTGTTAVHEVSDFFSGAIANAQLSICLTIQNLIR